jgi:hypothetical protein
MLAAALGTGNTRWRFESDEGDAGGPDGIRQLKWDSEQGAQGFSIYYFFTLGRAQSRHAVNRRILHRVCG